MSADLSLHFSPGRVRLAQEALDGIEQEMESWDRRMFRMQRDALRSRLEIQQGEYEPAFREARPGLPSSRPAGR